MYFSFLKDVMKSRSGTICSGLMMLTLIWAISPAQAGTYDNAMKKTIYRAFAGDVNGDGRPDVLLKADMRIIMLPLGDDDLMPIPIPPLSPTFVLLSQGDDSFLLTASPATSIVDNAVWQANSHDLIFGDVLGNGAGSILIRARSAGHPSFVVAMSASTGTLQLVQQLTPATIGVDLGATSTTVVLQDQNADGRTDLIVSVNGRVTSVLIADENGAFHSDHAATIRATWKGMVNALDAADAATALSYILPRSRDSYSEIFTALGPNMRLISSSLTSFDFVSVSSNVATAVVAQSFGGNNTIGFVYFVSDSDGWHIVGF